MDIRYLSYFEIALLVLSGANQDRQWSKEVTVDKSKTWTDGC